MSDTLRSIDPATGETVWEGAQASASAVQTAFDRARKAFPGWAATPLDERIAVARRFAEVLEARKDALAETIARETGKALWECRAEIGSMTGKVALSIRAHEERTGATANDMPFGQAVLRHNPHGVMAVLGPFNFPGHLPNGHIVPALIAGNTAVFKPSELTPATGAAMVDAWREAGLPGGVLEIVQGGRDTGAALIGCDIDGLLFTGSAGAGAHFRKVFADRPKVILALELGGNNPLIAWDGDEAETAALVVQSAFITTGQRCSCARRLIVPDTAFGQHVIEAVASLADRLVIGPWNSQPAPFMGPLISAAAATQARAAVEELVASGAKPVRAMRQIEGLSAAFVTPAVLDATGVDLPDEEVFAPALTVTRVADFDAAMAAANDTRFGLSAGLVSADPALWDRFVREIRAGVVNRNRPTTGASGAMPFGGLGLSGNHRPGGYYAADYCAYPVASFEADGPGGALDTLAPMVRD
jgi:succinylglutamic semialdehyde dehydrogenase